MYVPVSGRRRFEYQELASERPHTQASSHEGKPVSPEESSDETSGGETGGESPPSEVRDEERKQIFLQRQKLGTCVCVHACTMELLYFGTAVTVVKLFCPHYRID